MTEQQGVDGRSLTRQVLSELARAWVGPWEKAQQLQAESATVRAIAESRTDDPTAAIEEIVPTLAFLHPSIVRAVHAFCVANADELERPLEEGPKVVPGVLLNPDMDDTGTGGGQQQDQAVDWEARFRRLEQWHADLEDEVVRLRTILGAMGAVAAQTVLPTNDA